MTTALLAGCGAGARPALVPVGEPLVQVQSGTIVATGEVENTAARPYSGIVQVVLKDAGGKIVGTASGAVNDAPPGATVPYSAVGPAPTGPHASARASVTTQLPR